MELEQTAGNEGDRPQWLGSLVRRGDEVAAPTAEPAFEESAAQWLGSMARPNDGSDEHADPSAGAGWTGSPVRSAVFAAPTPELAPPAGSVHELAGRERVVTGALGMTLRVAA